MHQGRTALDGLRRWILRFTPFAATKERRPRGPGQTARMKRFAREQVAKNRD